MINYILGKVFGTKQERDIKRLEPILEEINRLEAEISSLTLDSLAAKTDEFKDRLKDGQALDDILPEAFAVVREAAKRTVKMRPFDVQIMGGIVLHEGKIAEMKTGEGKTLAATMPVYLNALTGKGAHIITVNDYLAKRDSQWMRPIYETLGLKVGVIQHDMDYTQRRQAYQADVTYGTNNEFGFDYLRDNMVPSYELMVQRGHHFAIVDEVDSILIDEARTPLIISGPAEESTSKYYSINRLIPSLKKDSDYQVDEKARSATLTEEGVSKAEKLLKISNLFDPKNIEFAHHVNQALKAHALFTRDKDYLVKDGEVLIIDEFTGRLMPGRRYSDGLHQALEAKEHLKIKEENQTLASITFQNYFRMYDKLAGMTGTADTEAEEFDKIYKLEVVVVPTNEPMIRIDHPDCIYKSEREKFEAVVEEIDSLYKTGQPVLVGTISVEKSEVLSRMLKKKGTPHQVLNAKHHEREAEIVAQAGRLKAVTISTNMAGRGTDIVLGGNPQFLDREDANEICRKEKEKVLSLGGLHILGTERHESRRIDNQLRGRSGRQGDPGSSRFHISLEDDLMRIFGSERVMGIYERLGLRDGEVIESRTISKFIERAQRQVESHNFDIRKHLLEYDDVMNQQRQIIYEQRRMILEEEDISSTIQKMIEELTEEEISFIIDPKAHFDDWDLEELGKRLDQIFGIRFAFNGLDHTATYNDLRELILTRVNQTYQARRATMGEEVAKSLEKWLSLQVVDNLWKDHLYSMDSLKEGVGLRSYAQQDPLIEYKKESFAMFEGLISKIREDLITYLFRAEVTNELREEGRFNQRRLTMSHQETGGFKRGQEAQPVRTQIVQAGPKIGRNSPCPCGSGKKYKNCCLGKG